MIHTSLLFLLTLAFVPCASWAQVCHMFSHGVGGNAYQAGYYIHHGILPESTIAFHFDDWHDDAYDRTKTALGQKPDIDVLNYHFTKVFDNQEPVVLFGVSRGAATVINFVGSHKPAQVKALILESPFAHVDDVINNMTAAAQVLPTNLIMKAVFPAYNPKGEQPIKLINQIPQDIPIAFICSKEDALVPYTSTERLYKALIAAGRRNVYLLVLPKGKHANLLDDPRYKKFVDDFLKIYGLSGGFTH